MYFSVDNPGAHPVHADTLGDHLQGKADGERVNGAFGCGVVDVLTRASNPGCG